MDVLLSHALVPLLPALHMELRHHRRPMKSLIEVLRYLSQVGPIHVNTLSLIKANRIE